jgi:D-alanine-D-alanine ligase
VRVAVVEGGPSTEAEVSRASARGVTDALEEGGHLVTRLELDPTVCERLRVGAFDVVFPVVHGAVGEDGSLQGVLEVLDLPYVGSDVLASALAMNKAMARVVLSAAGCPIARGGAVKRGSASALACARRARATLGAIVVKPASSGSAIGVTRLAAAKPDGDVAAAIDEAWKLDDTAIVEELVEGREVTCSVLDVEGAPRVLAATEIASPNDAFYTYEARYAPNRSVHTCPALLGDALTQEVHEAALAAHVALGCRDLSRADFIVGERAVLLEVNTLPGMTATSLYPEAARAVGMSFSKLCSALVENARTRGPRRRNAARAFPT